MVSFLEKMNKISNFINEVWQKKKPLLSTVLLVTLTSIVYIYPFGSYFRFTLAIVLLTTFLLFFEQLPIVSGTVITGLVILIFRTTIDFLTGANSYTGATLTNLPALAYYISFGSLFYLLSIRDRTNNILELILLLSMTDIISNVVELLFRSELVPAKFALILPSIVVVAVVRAVLAIIGYYVLKQYQSFILANEQAERYIEQTLMVAKLKSELFYLEKSSQDIEDVMEKAYLLYTQLNSQKQEIHQSQPLLADQALGVAREIHEVKKDYYRVKTGIENILKTTSKAQEIKLSDILYIIEQNTIRYLNVINKEISVTFEQTEDFVTDRHYTLVSILDNLLINSIEACGDNGMIRVTETTSMDEVFFCVEDNGTGIDQEEFDLIFNPGYSTKFSPRTGKISTGLGLAHVKDYIELFGGTIRVESNPGICTKFLIALPRSSIIVAGNDVNK